MPKISYAVVSPVKDEEKYIERTLRSMEEQTVKPVKWVIVDDGSTDRTAEIIEQYALRSNFIHLHRAPIRTARQTGTAEVHAFNAGLALIQKVEFDCIVKLDGDLSFEPDYFEKLLLKFSERPKLGIASGIYQENDGSEWMDVHMPSYHAAGASKVVRRNCFSEIGGFLAQRGWDTVDEIRAMACGWETTHFAELRMKHWKPEGTGMGRLRTSYMHGEIYYRTGGGFLFFALKLLNRLRSTPVITGAIALAWGYFHALLEGRELLVTEAEARCYRRLLNSRLTSGWRSNLIVR
jgi:glycosyltransferase involved in cell wall biosynthesis